MGQQTSTHTNPLYFENNVLTKNNINNYILYILELSDGKYYVGKTRDPLTRINNHIHNNGIEWTSIHKPIKILNIFKMKDTFDEDKYTLELMRKKGINNVRGGSFCDVKLDDNDINTIIKMIYGSEDSQKMD